MKITDKEKEILDSFYSEDMSREELAEKLHCSKSSLRSRLKHCRDRNHIYETSHLIAKYFHEK